MRPSNSVRAAVMNDLRALSEHGVKVFAVSGHHDTPKSIEEGVSPLQVYGNSGYMHYFANPSSPETVTLKLDTCLTSITGVGHNPLREGGSDPLAAIQTRLEGDFNIVLAHAPVQGFSGWTGDEPIIRPSSIPRELDLLVVGHFHNHQTKSVGRTKVIYPGSTERVDFAEEADEKGFVWIEFDKGGIISKDFVKTDARPYRTVKLDFPGGPKPVERLEEEVTEFFDKELVLRVKISGIATPISLTGYRRSELLEYCQGKVFHCFVDEDELTVQTTERIDLGPRVTPLEELKAHFKKQMETANDEERIILTEALQLSLAKLQEAGAW
jgi:DNA repair protein SbcD/Mre11